MHMPNAIQGNDMYSSTNHIIQMFNIFYVFGSIEDNSCLSYILGMVWSDCCFYFFKFKLCFFVQHFSKHSFILFYYFY